MWKWVNSVLTEWMLEQILITLIEDSWAQLAAFERNDKFPAEDEWREVLTRIESAGGEERADEEDVLAMLTWDAALGIEEDSRPEEMFGREVLNKMDEVYKQTVENEYNSVESGGWDTFWNPDADQWKKACSEYWSTLR